MSRTPDPESMRQRVLASIRDVGIASADEISQRLDVPRDKVVKAVESLKADGEIVRAAVQYRITGGTRARTRARKAAQAGEMNWSAKPRAWFDI